MAKGLNILVLNGPNLNKLGTREPKIYGSETLGDIEARCRDVADKGGAKLEWRSSQSEADLVDAIQRAGGSFDWILINAAGLTHLSVPIRDALAMYPGHSIEIHLSNVHKRESFRHHSMISAVVDGVVLGFGSMSYVMAIRGVIEMEKKKES